MTEPSKRLRPQMRTMPQLLADDIRDQIVRGELKPGESLPPEKQLLESYGLSRPTLREAMRILEAEALIKTQLGVKGGAIVSVPDPDVVIRQAGIMIQMRETTILDIYVARSFFEPPAARYLAENHPEKSQDLRVIMAEAKASIDTPAVYAKCAGQFHRSLVELCDNLTLSLFAQILGRLTDATYAVAVSTLSPADARSRIELTLRSWAKLIRLIEASDSDGAERHWRAHMAEVGKYPGFAQKAAYVAASD